MTFLFLLTDFQILEIKFLFVSVIATQNLRLEIPTLELELCMFCYASGPYSVNVGWTSYKVHVGGLDFVV